MCLLVSHLQLVNVGNRDSIHFEEGENVPVIPSTRVDEYTGFVHGAGRVNQVLGRTEPLIADGENLAPKRRTDEVCSNFG